LIFAPWAAPPSASSRNQKRAVSPSRPRYSTEKRPDFPRVSAPVDGGPPPRPPLVPKCRGAARPRPLCHANHRAPIKFAHRQPRDQHTPDFRKYPAHGDNAALEFYSTEYNVLTTRFHTLRNHLHLNLVTGYIFGLSSAKPTPFTFKKAHDSPRSHRSRSTSRPHGDVLSSQRSFAAHRRRRGPRPRRCARPSARG